MKTTGKAWRFLVGAGAVMLCENECFVWVVFYGIIKIKDVISLAKMLEVGRGDTNLVGLPQ